MVVCSKCKIYFMITEELYKYKKTHGSKIICPSCLSISKREKYRKASISHKNNWKNLTPEDRYIRIKNAADGIHNMSDEAKLQRSKNSSIATKMVMASLTDEERIRRSRKLSEANKRRYENMSDEEKKAIGHAISIGQINMEHDKKIIINKKRSESMKKYISSLTKEEIDARNKRTKDWWDNLTPEEFQKWNEERANGYKRYLENINIVPSKNELDMIKYMNDNKISYQFQYYNKYKHPDFDTKFPFNVITGSKFNNPYHRWDFIIHTMDKDILIDIDGSIHFNESYYVTHPSTNITYSILDYHKFKDSQRVYQTDGLDAYAILCRDDNLCDNTEVININTNEVMSFKALLSIILWCNSSNKEKDKLMKYK